MKKIITSLAVASVLASGLYAWQGGFGPCGGNGYGKHPGYGKHYGQGRYYDAPQGYYRGGGMYYGGGLLAMLDELDLSADQRTKISGIMKDARKNQELPCDAFTKDGFNKDKYKKAMKDRVDMRAERQADIMEKVYNVLDSKQKEQLKTLMDLRKQNMQRAFGE